MKSYLIHRPKKYLGRSHRGSHLAEFGNFRVDEWWVLKHYGRAVLDILERDGKYVPPDKEIIIVKVKPTQKEAI